MLDEIVLGEDALDFRQKCFAVYDLLFLTFDLILMYLEVTLKSVQLQRSSEKIPISCSRLIGNLLDSLNQNFQERFMTIYLHPIFWDVYNFFPHLSK